MACEACAIGAGRLDPDRIERAVSSHPLQRCLVTDRGGRKRRPRERAQRDSVEHRCDVGVGMGVEAAGDTAPCWCHHDV